MRAVESQAYLLDLALQRDKVSSFKNYPFSIDAVRNLDRLELHPKVTFFVGENGSGKSTLIEAMAVSFGLNPEGGSHNFTFGTRESHSELYKFIRLGKGIKRPKDRFFLRAESFFNVATEIEEIDKTSMSPPIIDCYGGVSLHEQSHGESFLKLLSERFFGNGLYFLDEPEAALSPTRQLAALKYIHELIKNNSQFIISTHSPILLAYPDAWIYKLSETGIERVEYKETEHYAVTHEFLSRPERMLDILFEEE